MLGIIDMKVAYRIRGVLLQVGRGGECQLVLRTFCML